MEEEIDLRPYIELLLRRMKWIIASGFILAIIAYLALGFSPKTYKATSLVFVAANNDVFQFDPRILAVNNEEPLSALPELARSDIILSELIKDEALAEIITIASLRNILQAETGSDRSLVRLTVVTQDPEKSARIANVWAELFITKINSSLGLHDNEQVAFFEDQLAQAEQTLITAEENLVSFQEVNRSTTISNTLAFYNEEQALQLANQQTLIRLVQDTEQLRDQLSNQPNNNPATFSDQLVALSLQAEGFNANSSTPLILQLDSDSSLIGKDKSEQIEFLNRLVEFLQLKLSIVENRLLSIEPEILRLQREWQEANVTLNRLVSDLDVASETQLSLARKVEEEKIVTQDTNRGLRLISGAVAPDEPESQNRLFITFSAGIIGLLVSLVVILIANWWRQEE